jgi:hypothetical protein
MQALFFLASIIAIMVILYWEWKNDAAGHNKPTTGLLRMTETAEPPAGEDDANAGEPAPESRIPPARGRF